MVLVFPGLALFALIAEPNLVSIGIVLVEGPLLATSSPCSCLPRGDPILCLPVEVVAGCRPPQVVPRLFLGPGGFLDSIRGH